MNNLKSKIKKIFMPVVIMAVVVAFALMTPVTSLVGAARLAAAAVVEPVATSVTGLPAHYVELNTNVVAPVVWAGNTALSKAARLYHAGRDVTEEKTTYDEIGKYEWKFYAVANPKPEEGNLPFDTYTVWAQAAAYSLVMPQVVPTMAPKSVVALNLPLPEKIMADHTELVFVPADGYYLDKNENGTVDEGEAKYYLTAKVSMGGNALVWNADSNNNEVKDVQIVTDDAGDSTIKIDMTAFDGQVGILKVTYLLKDANNKLLVAKVLNDITIKNISDLNKVTFEGNPSAPSVASLAYEDEFELTAPVATTATYEEETFTSEAWTKITGVKYVIKQPDAWSDVNWATKITDPNDSDYEAGVDTYYVNINNTRYVVAKIDGLKVTTKQLGWFKFQFTTETLFGYKTANADDKNGVYESDAVQIKQDSTIPEFKWVQPYTPYNNEYNEHTESFQKLFAEFEDINGDADLAKYLPLISEPSDSKAKTITVKNSITFPAILARDNGTAYDKLSYKVTVAQMKDSSGASVTSSTSNKSTIQFSLANSRYTVDEITGNRIYDYVPWKALTFNFNVTNGTNANNNINLSSGDGLYQVTFQVTETQPVHPDQSKGTGYDRSATKTYYFRVSNDFVLSKEEDGVTVAKNAPVIEDFTVNDVYLWEGHTFEFAIPTYSDNNTPTANLQADYFLVSAKTVGGVLSTQVAKLDAATINGNRMTVDLTELRDQEGNLFNNSFNISGEGVQLYVYAVVRNFNALQTALNNIANTGSDQFKFPANALPADGSSIIGAEMVGGTTFKRAAFKVHAMLQENEAAARPTFTLRYAVNDDNDEPVVYTVGDSTEPETLLAGEKVTLDTLSVQWGADVSDRVDGKASVSVYRVKDGQRTAVQVYNAEDEVVSAVAFNHNIMTLRNWYFMPDVGAIYELVIVAKENASERSYYQIYQFDVKANNEWEGNLTLASLAMQALEINANDALTVGAVGTLPGWEGKDANGTPLVAKNRLLYNANDLTDIKGYYTITVKGVNDPNCVIGNKFIPNYAGTYKFEYNFYLNGSNKANSNYSFVYSVTVTEASDTASILLDENYGQYADHNYEIEAGTVILDEFMVANKGGSKSFILSNDFLAAHLYQHSSDDNNAYYYYPAIAVPMPNIVNGAFSAEDVEITVQRSGSTEYLVSSKKKNVDGDSASKLENVNGYYVFRPEGEFKFAKDVTPGDDFMNYAVSSNVASAVYVVTYTLPDGTSTAYNITVGNPEVGALVFDLSNKMLTYKDGNDVKTIDNENTKPVIEKQSGGNYDGKRIVTLDLTKVSYNGANENFMAKIAKGVNNENDYVGLDEAAATEQRILDYMWANASVTITLEGASYIDSWDWNNVSDEDIIAKKDNETHTYIFELQGSGTYKISISLYNQYTQSSAVKTFEFTIDTTSTNKNINLNTVWGVILVVLAVGLLAAVIFYFIKTARETRFLDNPKMPKEKKVKAPKQDNSAEKTEKNENAE